MGDYKINHHLPIFLNMEDKKILIIGGGELAFELILYILDNDPNADLQLISEEIDERIEELQMVCSNFTTSRKSFENTDLLGREIVFITLKNKNLTLNIAKEAKQKGILVNAPQYTSINDFHIQFEDKEPSEIQKYTEGHWKRIAFLSIASFSLLIIIYVLSLFITFEEISIGATHLFEQIDERFYWLILVGFIAQLIDGLLGMGYGLCSTVALLGMGVPLSAISGSIHTAEMFSSGASGLSHYKFGNVNKKLLKFLIIPGVMGAIMGAAALSKFSVEYSHIIKPFLAVYTFLLGIRILYKVFKKQHKIQKIKNVGWLALTGGFLDSFGGGGWGPLVTSTLISKGKTPRFVIGTVSLSEFFITLASALTFFAFLGLSHWQVILGLVIGGTLASPLAAKLAGKLPTRAMLISVGILVILWSLNILIKTFLN
ncbi:MAG: TSUP family transporter [Flavobacteriaceae bacterium]|nr:TSUP family transporter [Flavobacteriaceae bacterium]